MQHQRDLPIQKNNEIFTQAFGILSHCSESVPSKTTFYHIENNFAAAWLLSIRIKLHTRVSFAHNSCELQNVVQLTVLQPQEDREAQTIR